MRVNYEWKDGSSCLPLRAGFNHVLFIRKDSELTTLRNILFAPESCCVFQAKRISLQKCAQNLTMSSLAWRRFFGCHFELVDVSLWTVQSLSFAKITFFFREANTWWNQKRAHLKIELVKALDCVGLKKGFNLNGSWFCFWTILSVASWFCTTRFRAQPVQYRCDIWIESIARFGTKHGSRSLTVRTGDCAYR